MRVDSPRWVEVTPSQFAPERAGLHAVRDLLPDAEPYRAWANLEFVADDGSANEVDLLVLARNGLHLVELKHWRGKLSGDSTTWVHNGHPVENPLLLATRKAKRLRSLLERVAREKRSRARVPYVRASVLLHAEGVTVALDAAGRSGVYTLDTAGNTTLAKIGGDLLTAPLRDEREAVDGPRGREIARLLADAGIRRSVRARTVGSVVVDEDVLAEGPGWQDYLGRHTALDGVVRRVRFYLVDRGATKEARATIARAARREFAVLEGISHPGIAQAKDYVDHERGPAVVFDRDPGEVRLDHFLAERGHQLSIDEQLQVVRSLAETIRYAHARRLVHRALNPSAVTVRRLSSDGWGVRVQDWQTGGRGSASQNPASYVAGTRHLDALIDPAAAPYIAPEAYTSPTASGVALDVFSLGAIAYLVFTGLPPAAGIDDLIRELAERGGLEVTAALDGAPDTMERLVYEATQGDVDLRTETAAEFLDGLDKLEEALTAPEVELIDPLDAQRGDIIGAGNRFHVRERLGAGSTAVALLVDDATRPENGPPVVLKIALDEGKADRLRAEAEVLIEVRERRVVELLDGPLTVAGRTALVLADAGRESLAELIRREGRLSIDLLERWGRDLLEVTQALDDVGVNHRDIKPDNLAYGELGKKHRRVHLRLFDFSLSRAPLAETKAGTPPYLDPFFDPVQRPRWDAAAERYAVAVTLFEMASGTVPVYGSGESHPTLVEDEATVEPEMFDPAVADGLVAFFRRALRRAPKERFHTVADMTQAWAAVFAAVPAAAAEATVEPVRGDDRDALARAAGPDTPLADSGLTPRAVSALSRYDVTTVGELLALGGYETSKVARVSEATRKEIRRRVREWRERLGGTAHPVGVEAEPATAAEAAALADATSRSLDAVLARLAPATTARNATEARAARLLLGLADPEGGAPMTWPTQAEVAARLGVTSARVTQVAAKARTRWARDGALAEVTDDLVRRLADASGVMGASELARVLLATRGSATDEPLRSTQALGLVRAAVEVEQERGGESRLDFRRTPTGVRLVALEPDDPAAPPATELLDHALALGRVATELAAEDPLPSAARCLERLRAVAPPEGVTPFDDARLPRIAAAASPTAAANSRGEIYPVGLPVPRALAALTGALAGGGTPSQVEERVRARYPEAAPLPPRPELDDAMRAAGLLLTWDGERFVAPSRGSSSVFPARTRTGAGEGALPAELADLEARLVTSLDTAAFLTFAVDPYLLDAAVAALVARFGVTPYDVTRELLAAMRREAEAGKVVWDVVLRADRADAPPAHAARLRQLVGQAAKPVERHLAEAPEPLLVIEAAPLARYDRLAGLEALADRTTRRPAARWLLVPADGGGPPKLDARPAPISSGWLRLPNTWVSHPRDIDGRAS